MSTDSRVLLSWDNNNCDSCLSHVSSAYDLNERCTLRRGNSFYSCRVDCVFVLSLQSMRKSEPMLTWRVRMSMQCWMKWTERQRQVAAVCLVFTSHVQQMLQSEAIDVSRCFIHEKYRISKAEESKCEWESEQVGRNDARKWDELRGRTIERRKEKSKQVNRET